MEIGSCLEIVEAFPSVPHHPSYRGIAVQATNSIALSINHLVIITLVGETTLRD